MGMYKETRLDWTVRLELVNNRIAYLEGQRNQIERELTGYMKERDLLNELAEVYKRNKEDPIDAERTALPAITETAPQKKEGSRPGKISRQVFELLATGPASSRELVNAIGAPVNHIGAACCYLVKTNKIRRIGRGLYERIEEGQND